MTFLVLVHPASTLGPLVLFALHTVRGVSGPKVPGHPSAPQRWSQGTLDSWVYGARGLFGSLRTAFEASPKVCLVSSERPSVVPPAYWPMRAFWWSSGPSRRRTWYPCGPWAMSPAHGIHGEGGGLALFAESLGPLLRQASHGRSPASSWLKSHFFPEGSRHTVPFGLAKRALCGSSHEAWAAPTGMMACWMSCAMMLVVCSDGARLNHAGRHWLPCAIMRLVGSDGLMALLRTAWAVIGCCVP